MSRFNIFLIFYLSVIIFIIVLFVPAAPDSVPAIEHDIDVSCIDGIEYWTSMVRNKVFAAVRVDPDTMSFVTCNN